MKSYVCSVCGYVYEESKGIPNAGIVPGTKWEALPDAWVCPLCGASKSAFREKVEEHTQTDVPLEAPDVDQELSPMEMSILCSNLAKGCEKQYMSTQAEQFTQLADAFRAKATPETAPDFPKLLARIEEDLEKRYPYANRVSEQQGDRGALRALVWSEKVTNMLRSLLERYEREGDKMLEHTGVYVCTICGFVFVGDTPPEICPVCKVPSWKFEKVEGRAM
ncbi:MAG: rubredoxin [Lawsonibacter sp.]|jgi:rubredoxin